jgi:hypothetical protein
MKLNKILTDKTVKFSKEWEGEIVEWSVKEKSLTPRVLQAFSDVQTRPIELANGLSGIVTDWSIFLEAEGDFPPTPENLAKLPFDFLNFMLESISETWAGGKPQTASQSTSAV